MLNRPELTADASSAPTVQIHSVNFWLNLHTGLWRAKCSCGWEWVHSDRDALNIRAAGHDINECTL